MSYQQTQNNNGTVKYTIKFQIDEIDKTKSDIEKLLVAELEIQGFRKGKVPFEIGQKQLDKEKIYQKTLIKLINSTYQEIVTQDKLKPITDPKIDLSSVKEGSDWEIIIEVAVKPEFTLPDYQPAVKDIKKTLSAKEIWVPGQDKTKTEDKTKNNELILQQVFEWLLKNTIITVPDLLVENEQNRRLTQLIDDVRQAGMTMDAYLATKKLTQEQIKNNIKKELTDMFKLEFILDAIADKENVVVNQKEIDDLIVKLKQQSKDSFDDKQVYMYTILLRRQKLLDFLTTI